METMVMNILIVSAALSSLFCFSAAIQCYYCNSAENTACLDVNRYEPEVRTRILPVVNCDRQIQSPNVQSFFCRKIVQTIFHRDRDSEVRVTRGCGWVRSHEDRPCYKVDSADHQETSCQCFHDYCNQGFKIPLSIDIMILSVLACLYI